MSNTIKESMMKCGEDHGYASCPGHKLTVRWAHTSDITSVTDALYDGTIVGQIYLTDLMFREMYRLAKEYYDYWENA